VLLSAAILAGPRAGATPRPDPERVVVLTRSDGPKLGTGELVAAREITGVADLDRLCRELGVLAIEPYYPGVLRRPRLARLAERLRVRAISLAK
jgi:hypothetical protein